MQTCFCEKLHYFQVLSLYLHGRCFAFTTEPRAAFKFQFFNFIESFQLNFTGIKMWSTTKRLNFRKPADLERKLKDTLEKKELAERAEQIWQELCEKGANKVSNCAKTAESKISNFSLGKKTRGVYLPLFLFSNENFLLSQPFAL